MVFSLEISTAGINSLFFFQNHKLKRFLVVHFSLWNTFFSLRNSLSNAYLKFSQLLKAELRFLILRRKLMFVNLISIVSLFSLQGIEFVCCCYLFVYFSYGSAWFTLHVIWPKQWLGGYFKPLRRTKKIEGNFHANISLVSLNQLFPINYFIHSVLTRR